MQKQNVQTSEESIRFVFAVNTLISSIMYSLFNRFQWYRKSQGGRWEKWLVDYNPGTSEQWFHISKGRDLTDLYNRTGRPHQVCRGTPTVENW
ncbi:hypothetical protein GR7B_00164 [Vibrio phage vB_VcorM_GR7B]|nr:hypothetical protein GR7B_00164 [Vibrio phage vB_VcorM_GR7B]